MDVAKLAGHNGLGAVPSEPSKDAGTVPVLDAERRSGGSAFSQLKQIATKYKGVLEVIKVVANFGNGPIGLIDAIKKKLGR